MRPNNDTFSTFALLGLCLGGLTACGGIGEHPVVAAPSATAQRTSTTWDDVFAHPTPLQVTAYHTGVVFTGPRILIDASDPRTPEDQKVKQWVPALSYLVRHPKEGAFLMDTGMRPAEADGSCDFGIPPFFRARCRAAPGQDVASQLRRDGVEPRSLRFALLSHLHGDHAGGLRALATDAPFHVLLDRREWEAASRTFRMFDGYIVGLLDGPYDVAFLPMDRAVQMPYVGQALDLFGDGSVWVFPTVGHSRGEIATLLNTLDGPLLFTFDTSHLRANLDHGVAPGFTVDHGAALDAVARLDALRRAYPSMRVFYGHEPTQWADKPRTVVLAGASTNPGAKP